MNAGNLILWQTFSRFVLIGWKLDLENDRKVSIEEAQKLAHEYNMLFYETSAKEWTNIDEIFQNLAKELVESANNFEIPKNIYAGAIHLHQQNQGFSIWMGPNTWNI